MTLAAIRVFLAARWAWLTSPLGRVLLTILAVLGLLGGVYALGHHNGVMTERAVWQAKVAKDAKTVATRVVKADTISAVAIAIHDTKVNAIVGHTNSLLQKVPTYVTPEDDSKCVVPAGAVSLLNASVSSTATIPETASGPVEAASDVALSAYVANDIFNVGVAKQALEENQTWRTWYADQVKAWGTPSPG